MVVKLELTGHHEVQLCNRKIARNLEGLVEFVEMEFRRLNDIQIFITKSFWRDCPQA